MENANRERRERPSQQFCAPFTCGSSESRYKHLKNKSISDQSYEFGITPTQQVLECSEVIGERHTGRWQGMVPYVLKSKSRRYRLHLLPKFLSMTKMGMLFACCVFQITWGSWSGADELQGVPPEHKPAENKEHLTSTGVGRRALPKMNPR